MAQTHIPTPDDIAQAKDYARIRAESKGLDPEAPVFQRSLTKRNFTFLYTWITDGEYQRIVRSDGYLKLMQKDPARAEQFLQTQILQECVLWPPTFTPADPVVLNSYPAGVPNTLYKSIMEDSGWSPYAGADRIVSRPEPPTPLSEEEKEQLMAAHPLAKRFGILGERMFTVREIDPQTGDLLFYPVRYYLYTAVDNDTYKQMMAKPSMDDGKDFLVEKAVLYPKNIDWSKEPANFKEWLFNAVLIQSGFTEDDPSYEVGDTSAEV